MLQERTIADKMDRQLTHRGAARSVTALAAMLAHEIKNPLSGIRGAAQLLEQSAGDDDRALTRLICDETDRIVKLVDRMEVFSDERPVEREPVNIHVVLDHVKRLAQVGLRPPHQVRRGLRSVAAAGPRQSRPARSRSSSIWSRTPPRRSARRDRRRDPADHRLPARRAPVAAGHRKTRVSLPLEFCVQDNGPGVPEDLLPHLFDPFVTTKPNGTGLGLALVAKIVGDHGGIIECESQAAPHHLPRADAHVHR